MLGRLLFNLSGNIRVSSYSDIPIGLFTSRKAYSASSDIDLVLISPEFDLNPNAHTPLLWLTAADTDYRIEPMAIGKLKFENDDISPIIAIAKQEGIGI